ncbi:hypothetical protein [Microbacterium sp. 18062]|uniref:hypothetical protein n=1 Tax=Microbacterium sp. 18062 TaxID=2681410 RepID=UPI0013593018|nr:hypothetical protein [Microbacterium sp. 18062]
MSEQTPLPDGGSIHDRWVVFVRADDRSGALTALAEMFSTRGISFTSFNTLVVGDGAGTMSILFRSSERLALVLARTLERLVVTQAVTLARASAPDVRAVAVVSGAPDGRIGPAAITPWGPGDTVLVAGAFHEVEGAIERMRPHGAVVESITVLPPA